MTTTHTEYQMEYFSPTECKWELDVCWFKRRQPQNGTQRVAFTRTITAGDSVRALTPEQQSALSAIKDIKRAMFYSRGPHWRDGNLPSASSALSAIATLRAQFDLPDQK